MGDSLGEFIFTPTRTHLKYSSPRETTQEKFFFRPTRTHPKYSSPRETPQEKFFITLTRTHPKYSFPRETRQEKFFSVSLELTQNILLLGRLPRRSFLSL